MKRIALVLLPISLVACSETEVDQEDEAAVAKVVKEIEQEAKSLEEAADEAVNILDAEIQAELESEGIVESIIPTEPSEE